MKVINLAEETEEFTGNVWLIENNGEKALVDVGTGGSWKYIRELESVEKVVITHSHYDHVDNLPKVEDVFSPQIYSFKPENLPINAEQVSEGDSVNLCGLEFDVLHTPGHKNDSICLYSPEKEILFTGDLIFPDGDFGRTDLEEGDRDQLIESLQKISDLEIEAFYPGHEHAVTRDANKWIKKSLEKARKREPKY